jgi:urocanate hydratase
VVVGDIVTVLPATFTVEVSETVKRVVANDVGIGMFRHLQAEESTGLANRFNALGTTSGVDTALLRFAGKVHVSVAVIVCVL